MKSRDLYESLADEAAEHFGITENPRECGYLLADGRMLDLSGRHWMLGGDYRRVDGKNILRRGQADYQANLRQVDHRDLDHLSEEGGTEGMLAFMRETGAIRVNPPNGFNLAAEPTRRQISMMCAMAKFFDDSVYLEVFGIDGHILAQDFFTNLTPAAIVAFIQKIDFARLA